MIELARVVAIHPGAHAVDVVLLRTGQRAAGVPLMTQGASTTTGGSDLPPITAPAGDERWNVPARGQNDALVVLAPTAGGNWIALGSLFPQINAVLSAEPGRAVYRHASGAWQMIAPDGTVTIGHPSGASITMGPNITPTNPVGGDVHGQWRHGGPNAAAQVGMHVTMPSGAELTIAPNGQVTLKAITQATFDTPQATFTGNVSIAGTLTMSGTNGTGNIETPGAIDAGGTIHADGHITSGSISLREHRHGGVQAGPSQTGLPVA